MTTTTERRDFGYIGQLPNGRFKARWRLNKKQSYKTFDTEAQAAKFLAKTEAKVGAGVYVDPKVERTTFDDLAGMLLNDYLMQGRRSTDRAELAINHLRAEFGSDRTVTITYDRIVAYVNARMKAGAKKATVYKEIAALRRMFSLARKARKLTTAQTPEFPTLEISNARTGFFELDDYAALVAELSDPVRAVVEFAYLTGWRKSEVLGLTWDRVDRDGGVVKLDVGTTKNGEGRKFPFDVYPALKAVLERQWKAREGLYVFHRNGARIVGFRAAWQGAIQRAAYIQHKDKDGRPTVKEIVRPQLIGRIFHDFRRTAVRNLVRAGVSEHTAMDLTGHKTRTIFDRYDIVNEADLRDGVAKLAALGERRLALAKGS